MAGRRRECNAKFPTPDTLPASEREGADVLDTRACPAYKKLGPIAPVFTTEQMIAEMDAIGVRRAVLVPPDSWIQNAVVYWEQAARTHQGRFGPMPSLDPTGWLRCFARDNER
jgi:hypothetical protein